MSHEILLSYLAYAGQKGFESAHMWACPTPGRDDVVLFRHAHGLSRFLEASPAAWHGRMLQRGVEMGIIQRVSNLYDEFLGRETSSLTNLPYFDGDFWTGEAELAASAAEAAGAPALGSVGDRRLLHVDPAPY